MLQTKNKMDKAIKKMICIRLAIIALFLVGAIIGADSYRSLYNEFVSNNDINLFEEKQCGRQLSLFD